MHNQSESIGERIAAITESKGPCVGGVYRLTTKQGHFRLWKVKGVFYGALNQESVVNLQTLDKNDNTEGELIVPIDLFRQALNLNRV